MVLNPNGLGVFGAQSEEPSVVDLIVEDGTGLADANSYASVEFGDDYFAAFSGSTAWDDAETATKESALRAATQYIDLRYGDRFTGFRLQPLQALAAPRTSAWKDGRTIEGIPVELEKATVEVAVRWIADATQLLPDEAAGSNVESRTVDVGGVRIGKTFQGSATTSKTFPIVDKLLRQSGLIRSGNFGVR